MPSQKYNQRMNKGKEAKNEVLAATSTYDNEVLDPRQIGNNLWIVFGGLYNGQLNQRRHGVCEFSLSRVSYPQSASDYVVADMVTIKNIEGDLSQGRNQPESLNLAVGIVYSRDCAVDAGLQFVFSGSARNPDVPEQQFTF